MFEPGSAAAEDAIAGWRGDAAEGITVESSEPGRPAIVVWLDGDVEVVSDVEVAFPICDRHLYRVLDGGGALAEEVRLVDRPARGEAVLVDGRWYLRELEILTTPGACRTAGPEEAR